VITEEQNTERQLQRLAAQRQLYATAKVVFGWQLFLSGPIALASAILVVANPSLKGFVAGWGILVAFADIFWLAPWQNRLRDSAARIQEAFDCDVLELPWNEVKAGNRPGPELIKEQFEKYAKSAAHMPTLTNWYAQAVGELPVNIGRIACQRSNCWWDAKQRRRYAASIIAVVALIIIVVLALSLGAEFTVEDFILKAAAPLAPALVLGIRQYRDQMEAAARLDRLRDHSERLWKDALSGKSNTELTTRSRILQDEILENRRKSPVMFDFIFKRLRPSYEEQMNFGVEELVAEASRGRKKRAR
jgi:hypothetical protein